MTTEKFKKESIDQKNNGEKTTSGVFHVLAKKEWTLPFTPKFTSIINKFSLTEKVIFYILVIIFAFSALSILWQLNNSLLIQVPDYGGTLSEGVLGSPRFINPLLALSDSDRDVTAIVYSGLLKASSDGTLVPDLAESFSISPDGLTYTFILKKGVTFHDGHAVTADDVFYTLQKIQDKNLQSPRKSSWSGVGVKEIDPYTIQFSLLKPYSSFIENTTVGILPKHIWENVTNEEFPFSQFNTKPVGSGPYKINSIVYSPSGLPSEYHLSAFKKYILGQPYISDIVIKSYQNETDLLTAYKNNTIDSVYGISPQEVGKISLDSHALFKAPLPRVFGVFFNQNVAPVFVYTEVRQALNMTVDRPEIIQTVLHGYGQAITGPIPPHTLGEVYTSTTTVDSRIAAAQALLTKKGWAKNASGIFQKIDNKNTVTLSFSISTGNAPELKATAEDLQKQWQQLGAQVSVKIFEISDLNQNIIRPRKYDSLLFGEIVGRDLDVYPFWHSSERTDPGLNIALYANLKVDKTLESLRTTTDLSTRTALLSTFNKEVQDDTPAVFLYSPYFIYVLPNTVHNVSLGSLNTASERLENIPEWYIETNKMWGIFKNKYLHKIQ